MTGPGELAVLPTRQAPQPTAGGTGVGVDEQLPPIHIMDSAQHRQAQPVHVVEQRPGPTQGGRAGDVGGVLVEDRIQGRAKQLVGGHAGQQISDRRLITVPHSHTRERSRSMAMGTSESGRKIDEMMPRKIVGAVWYAILPQE